MNTNRKKIIESLSSYVYAGKLPLMLCLIPFFINNKKGMELFRERLDLSVQGTLKRRFFNKTGATSYQSSKLIKLQKKHNIWFMWLQGIDNAPELCRTNYMYLKKKFGDGVHLITADNVFDYVEIPDFIKVKWINGTISNTHFSDIIRVQLLSTYGGTWIDATVFINSNFLERLTEFCLPQTFKPGSNGHALPVSSWFINVPGENKYIERVRDLLFLYWEKNNRLIDYFLLHHFFIIVSDEMDNYLDNIYPLDNSMPHYPMLLMKRRKVSSFEIESFLKDYKVMKFTYKTDSRLEDDNYVKLIDSIGLL
ncbi:capsular polysaccharide synthesis protein [Lactiplantibacillus pentosus]|uniref:capsular polysaccharide synthesis protein n=1 Tax=Lactiplantibacillus pentosus TaxID=1589 RepID=UPI001C1F2613|nr:capsular polysaccharide synthesis protein [Lactiplantibacillus pentosus]MBU7481916.1 glycosyl transferase [Lactiplantibacillus pentosus]